MNQSELPGHQSASPSGNYAPQYAPVRQMAHPNQKLFEWAAMAVLIIVFAIGYAFGNENGYSNGRGVGQREGYEKARQDIILQLQKNADELNSAMRRSFPQQPVNPNPPPPF